MKAKLYKILGVALTVVMLASLFGFALPAAAAAPAEKINEWYKYGYPKAGSAGDWFRQGTNAAGELIDGVSEITQAIKRPGDLYADLYVYVDTSGGGTDHIFKSEDGGRTWAATGYEDVEVCSPDEHPDRVFDMAASSIDADVLYVTDGYYVYKTEDGGDTFDFVDRTGLEKALGGDCGCCLSDNISWRTITSIDVGYYDDNPYVFIGTRAHTVTQDTFCVAGNESVYPGSIYYIAEDSFSATWTNIDLACYGDGYEAFAIGCAPDYEDSMETYAVVSDGSETHVVKIVGGACPVEFAELEWNCTDSFGTWAASRIGFPDDFDETGTLFVGITDANECKDPTLPAQDGGDVYAVTYGEARDLNVAGGVACAGITPVDIISLDVQGDTDEAELIAGAYCNTDVYYSADGGWSWDDSDKNPTGEELTYVIFYEGSALAATSGCEAAVSMSCGEEVGQYWNQISLIATNIDAVRWLGFSPGYLCDSKTMFMVTAKWGEEMGCGATASVFRYDGTYWERVFLDETYEISFTPFWMLEVSPDFNTTSAVYLTDEDFEIFRTTDAGCSWDQLAYPCPPDYYVKAMEVIDEETVIVGGVNPDNKVTVFKTTKHGSRPWKEYKLPTGAGVPYSFALKPGYADPGTIVLGDAPYNGVGGSQVFISEDGAETWKKVDAAIYEDPIDGGGYDTSVVFDPTSDIIYAATFNLVVRCVIDPDAAWADQEWETILIDNDDDVFRGIAAAGDTALYVTNRDDVEDTSFVPDGVADAGGVLRSLNPDTADADDVVFERLTDGLVVENANPGTELRRLWLTCGTSDKGCDENVLWSLEQIWADGVDNVWVYEDTLAAPVVLTAPFDDANVTTTGEATLSWEALCGADCYEVALYKYCPQCPDEKLDVSSASFGRYLDCACSEFASIDDHLVEVCTCIKKTCIVVDDLDAGTTYYWKVRVCYGEPKLSKWSDLYEFTTAMLVPVRCSPVCGSENLTLTPNFSWSEIAGATSYEIQIATNELFSPILASGTPTVNAWDGVPKLAYDTTYYWRVRAVKGDVVGAWTTCLFSTQVAPAAKVWTCPLDGLTFESEAALKAHNTAAHAPVIPVTPVYIWVIVIIGAVLVIAVIILIVTTRRTP